MNYLLFFLGFSLAVASPTVVRRASVTPTAVISSPSTTITGKVGIFGEVEQFLGVPFAQPPVDSLRLKPPAALETLGSYTADQYAPACPQFFFSTEDYAVIPTEALGYLLDTPLFQTVADESEDCLYMNIYRPPSTNSSSALPVLFWIFGGGFELGDTTMYDGASWVTESIREGQPIIFVAVSYRVGGFGFLPGAEVLADGAANLGLLDQRLGLEWVADNIAAFGGDPDKVTIWGESAGAISVLDQMILYDGDYTYNDKPLFRGGIMNSGSIIPADPVDCAKGQQVYDTVVDRVGCSSSSDTLECLREANYTQLLNAFNSVPGILSYYSVDLSYLPRPDGVVLTQSPDILVQEGKYPPIPFIIGDQEDEGTLFALFQPNITTREELVDYLSDLFFYNATDDQLEELVSLYPTISDGSPFRTGLLNNWYPQFKILAAILGDLTFTITRRIFLNTANMIYPDVPTWSYLSSYDYGTPILGTFHGSDLLQVFYGVYPDYAATAFHSYYISFVNTLDPNNYSNSSIPAWPRWSETNELVNMHPLQSTLITDDFRNGTYDFLSANIESFYI